MIGAMGPRRDRHNGNGLARHRAGDRGAAWGRGSRCGMASGIEVRHGAGDCDKRKEAGSIRPRLSG